MCAACAAKRCCKRYRVLQQCFDSGAYHLEITTVLGITSKPSKFSPLNSYAAATEAHSVACNAQHFQGCG